MDGSIRVVALKGNEPVGAWEFDKELVTIGRSKTADVRLDDAAISRVHCIVEVRPSGVFIKDNGSRNGIWLNGKRVNEAMLSSRDEVVVERFRLKAYMVWGQNTSTRNIQDKSEVKTNVRGPAPRANEARVAPRAAQTDAPKAKPAAPAAKPVAKPAAAPTATQPLNRASRSSMPVAPALEETGAMEAPARARADRRDTAEEILSEIRPRAAAPKMADATDLGPRQTRESKQVEAPRAAKPAARPEAKPLAKPAARPSSRPAAKPVPPVFFDEYDDEDEEDTLPPAFSMTDVVATAKSSKPSEGRACVEVIRYRGVNVLDVSRLERGMSYLMPFSDIELVSFDGGDSVSVDILDGMNAELRSGRGSRAVAGSVAVRAGEVLDVQIDDVGYLVRLADRVELERSAPMNTALVGGLVGAGVSSVALHVFVAGVLMLVQALKPETPKFTEFAKIDMPKEPEEIAKVDPTPAPTPAAKPTPPPPMPKMKEPPTRLAKRPMPTHQVEGGADRTEAKVASAGVLGGLGKVNVKLDSPNSALAAVTNLDAVRSTAGRGGGFKVSALTGKVPGDAVLGRAGRANGTVEISTLSGNDLGARGGFGGHALNGGGKVKGVVTQTPTSNVGVQGTLSREEIAAVVNKHINEVRRCYEKNLINDPSLAGKIQVEWTINPNGSVAGVKTKFSSLKGGDVTGCISGAIRTWMFPKPKGNGYVIVNYPFMFDSVGF